MARPLDEAKELDLYGDPDLVAVLDYEDELQDGVVLKGLFYPLYVNGERNPALRWVSVMTNGKQEWTVAI